MKKYNEAINIIMQALGEPLLATEDSIDGIFEAEQADFTLEQVKTEVLSEGWFANTDENWLLVPDEFGYIGVPANSLRIISNGIIVKDGKLYNKQLQTYKFDYLPEGGGITCNVLWDLDFDDLPYAFQRFIALRAARLLSQRLDGDVNMIRILMNDEQAAKFLVEREDFESAEYSIFDNDSVRRIVDRKTNPRAL